MFQDALFSGSAPFDLGPTAYLPGDWHVRTSHVVGLRSSHLRAQLRLLAPNEPGVYAMLNADDEIIYVGKASERAQKYWAGKQKKVIEIVFNSSQFGEVDIKTGDFEFAGQD